MARRRLGHAEPHRRALRLERTGRRVDGRSRLGARRQARRIVRAHTRTRCDGRVVRRACAVANRIVLRRRRPHRMVSARRMGCARHRQDRGRAYKKQGDDAVEKNGAFAWETHFYSAGAETSWHEFTLMAQGMNGYTAIEPIEDVEFETEFKSLYALGGWESGQWRAAIRADLFQTREDNPGTPLPTSEDGHSFTAAGTWSPYGWLRLTAEAIYVDSTRDQRAVVGIDPHQTQTQLQLLARFYY